MSRASQRSNWGLYLQSISMLTVLAFTLLLEQFFHLSRELKIHTYIGYAVFLILLMHPFLIVLPGFYKAGVEPLEAFITMLTNFDSRGVVVGLIAWSLLLLLAVTSIFAHQLMSMSGMSYTTWNTLHGVLSVIVLALAVWHAIDQGRHIDTVMSEYIVALAISEIALLLNKQCGENCFRKMFPA